jgi:hypothetical protein
LYPAVVKIGVWARRWVRPRPTKQRTGQDWKSVFISGFPLRKFVPLLVRRTLKILLIISMLIDSPGLLPNELGS